MESTWDLHHVLLYIGSLPGHGETAEVGVVCVLSRFKKSAKKDCIDCIATISQMLMTYVIVYGRLRIRVCFMWVQFSTQVQFS